MPKAAPLPVPVVPVVTCGGKSRLIYLLLALFLGEVGVHHFYAGRIGLGVLQLLLSLVSCDLFTPVVYIWAIIEVCVVKKDGSGIPFRE